MSVDLGRSEVGAGRQTEEIGTFRTLSICLGQANLDAVHAQMDAMRSRIQDTSAARGNLIAQRNVLTGQ
jgi:hypothetical protein